MPNDFSCDNCTLRLLRQADEWSSGYRFWSCADVDIKQRKEYKETCSGNGKYFPSRCKCEKNFYGSQCQYKDECSRNQDCGVQGKCIDLQGTSVPGKQCYCNYGWYGADCKMRSPYKNTDFDLSPYTMKHLSPEYTAYWRLLEEQAEIEFVLKVNTTTWVGFGWRPLAITKECKNFPLINDLDGLPNAKVESAEPDPSSDPKPELEAFSEPKSEPKFVPEPNRELEPKINPESITKSKHLFELENPLIMDGVTAVATSVSYRVSASSGRMRRDVSGNYSNFFFYDEKCSLQTEYKSFLKILLLPKLYIFFTIY